MSSEVSTPSCGGGAALETRLAELCDEVVQAIDDGARVIVLSDRHATADVAPMPSLLMTSAVHHHLVRERLRSRVGLVVEAGDVREVHHVALLIGYGAAAVNPYLAMETVEDLARRPGYLNEVSPQQAVTNLVRALGKGVLKVMSKIGVSTIASYTGAQIFEAVGLGDELVERYFTGTASRLGGIGIDVVADEVAARHRRAYSIEATTEPHRKLEVGGEYQWRREGEPHLFDPESVFRLQHATRSGRYDIFRQYTARVDEQSKRLMTLRGLMSFSDSRDPVPLEEVEPVSEIVKRFSTGAMSYGSISQEAHETLAVAMNLLGARSNTGEGGEDADRLHDPVRRSAIKQVASGRFGVTSDYLTSADDIQIKMAQGAKPGEGGQLPGSKVYPWIAKTRGSTPGVGLISPPPHHDIYSIEDLAQLIHDLKNASPKARIHVKLVSETGVGTVAAGVSKAHADVVLISGHDGGTGAAPMTSLKHAGGPWEVGLAETQQTLLLNGLRDRIVVQCDGQLKTGRDVMVAALLGAEEFGFATAPLVVVGCILMRVCHLDTCPVGIATQNPELRSRYTGRAEHVVRFFEYVAEEVRELLASLGFRTLDEAVGRAELLDTRAATEHWKAAGLDLAPLLHVPPLPAGTARHRTRSQDHGLDKALDNELVSACAQALERGEPVRLSQADPQRQPDGRHDAGAPRHEEPAARTAGRHDRRDVQRIGGPVLRCVPAPRDHPAGPWGRERLRGQGAVGRAGRRTARPALHVRRRVAGRGRQCDRVRRHVRFGVRPWRGGRALCGPELRGEPRRGGRRRPRLRVHDRRRGRHPGTGRAQPGSRDERRNGVRPRPVRRPGQPGDGGPGAARGGSRGPAP